MPSIQYINEGENLTFKGYKACRSDTESAKPAVLVVHDWSGCNEFACQKADKLAALGYVGFAVDMYGEGRIGYDVEEKKALMQPLMDDRRLLCSRMNAALKAVVDFPEVDKARIAVIGFCFGGLCALDLARSGADIRGAVSFHGLLTPPLGLDTHPIRAKIMVFHGYDDPMVPPEQVLHFSDEMTKVGADWQMHLFGHTQHAFTNPQANDKVLGTVYHPQSDARSWALTEYFLNEVLLQEKSA